MKGHLPNLITIGTAKCGTTSLHYYLSQHPEIVMSRQKELNFFIEERNWKRGFRWYTSQFRGEAKIYGESSQAYSNYPSSKGVARRISQYLPDIKMIYLVRDPIDRTISHYLHHFASGKESRPLSAALRDALDGNDSLTYLSRGKYYLQISQFLAHFDRSQILVLTSDELYTKRLETLKRIFTFLDVDKEFYSSRFLNIRHQTHDKSRKNKLGSVLGKLGNSDFAYTLCPSEDFRRKVGSILYRPVSTKMDKQHLDDDVKAELIQYYKHDLLDFKSLTDLDISHWSVFA